MQVTVSDAIMQLEVSAALTRVTDVGDNFYCNYAGGSLCCNYAGGIFCSVLFT